MSIKSVMPSHHLILCQPLLLPPSIFPSIRVFSNESALHIRWPKYWRFSFSISPSNEYSGLTSFRMDQLDLLAGQGTFQSLLQHYNLKASILWVLVFFLDKAEEPGIKLPTSAGSWKKQESSRKTSTSTLLTMPKPLTMWITTVIS